MEAPSAVAHEAIRRYDMRYEVRPYYVVPGTDHKKVQAGFDVDLYGKGHAHKSLLAFDETERRTALQELVDACREVLKPLSEDSLIEVTPAEETLVLNLRHHLEPEALVRIRITHDRGLDQPAGPAEDKAL